MLVNGFQINSKNKTACREVEIVVLVFGMNLNFPGFLKSVFGNVSFSI